jgi:hypothetical protein
MDDLRMDDDAVFYTSEFEFARHSRCLQSGSELNEIYFLSFIKKRACHKLLCAPNLNPPCANGLVTECTHSRYIDTRVFLLITNSRHHPTVTSEARSESFSLAFPWLEAATRTLDSVDTATILSFHFLRGF